MVTEVLQLVNDWNIGQDKGTEIEVICKTTLLSGVYMNGRQRNETVSTSHVGEWHMSLLA